MQIDACLLAGAKLSLNMAKLQHNMSILFIIQYVTFQQPQRHQNRFPLRYVSKVLKTYQVSKSVLFCVERRKKIEQVFEKSVFIQSHTVHACELRALTYSATKSSE